jgi:protease I
MKALIISADRFEDLELFYPYYRLREQGLDVDVASPRGGRIEGIHGYTVEQTHPLDQIDPDAYSLVVIPGGRAPEKVRLSPHALAIVRHFTGRNKPVAAICHGAQVLISARVLPGRILTCWEGIRDDVIAAGGGYEDAEVVVDGNLVSSRRPADLPAFCREIIRRIKP